MKKYIVYTSTDWSFAIAADNYRDAVIIGRRICRGTSDKFTRVKMVK